MTDIPISLAGLTGGWLTDQLRDAGHSVSAISSLAVEPMDGFVGAMGEVGIVNVEWDGDAGALPSSFVAKCPLDDDIARLYNQVMQYYVRESGFYRELVSEVDMRTPTCWVNRFDPESGNALLLLEHVQADIKGDILVGTTVDNLRVLVADLARMHGQFWMDPRLPDIDWLMDWATETFQMGVPIIGEGWAQLTEQEPDRVPADIREVVEASWINDTLTWLARYEERPWTLTHIDYELDNILFDADGPIVVDWQSVMRSFPGADLSWLLAVSHNDETLAAEPELLDLYRAELAAAGGPEFSPAELEEELAWGILQFTGGAPVPYLQDTSAYGPGGERMHERFDAFLQGCLDACGRWNVVGHIGKHL